MNIEKLKVGNCTVVIKSKESGSGKVRGTVAVFSKNKKPVFIPFK
jgi:hypothetical protein